MSRIPATQPDLITVEEYHRQKQEVEKQVAQYLKDAIEVLSVKGIVLTSIDVETMVTQSVDGKHRLVVLGVKIQVNI